MSFFCYFIRKFTVIIMITDFYKFYYKFDEVKQLERLQENSIESHVYLANLKLWCICGAIHKKKNANSLLFRLLAFSFAVWTGLEPATPCVTGRYSNQLNYHTILFRFFISSIFSQMRCKDRTRI